MYVKVQDGVATKYSIAALKLDNPNVSFPSDITNAVLAEWDVYPLKSVAQPAYNELYQRLEEADPVQIDGEWCTAWNVIDLTADEVNQKRFNMSITPRQARLLLSRMGLLTDIQTYLENQGNEEALIEWEYATSYNRLSQWVLSVQTQMAWTDEQLDQMFIDGAKI